MYCKTHQLYKQNSNLSCKCNRIISISNLTAVGMASFNSTFFLTLALLLLQFSHTTAHGGSDDGDGDTAAADKGSLHAKGLVLVKIWCLIIMFVSTFAGGVSPYFYRWNESFLLLGTQFAGGVFLGTSLMHFLSDSTSTFADLTPKEYPFSFMLASAGYLLTMLADSAIAHLVGGGGREMRVDVEEGGAAKEEKELNPVFVKTASYGDTILLILALCFHSIFEGIAVGVAGS